MRIVLNKMFSIAAILTLFASLSALGTELVRTNQKSVAFRNYSSSSSIILLGQAGQLVMLNDLKAVKGKVYKVDTSCNLKTQNTVMMSTDEGGMTLAYPYFVGVGKVCMMDETTNSIRLVSNFKTSLPRNAFSVTYAGQDSTAVYFLLNGRPYPEGTVGYISALVINKADQKVSVRNLLTDVPGFSAAMVYDGAQIWVTTWYQTNDIYKLSTAQLLDLIKTSGTAQFSSVTTKTVGGFEGMSSFALKNDSGFLFFNDGFDSFKINLPNSAPAPIKPSCEPIAGEKTSWISLCEGTRLELMDLNN